MPLTLENQNLYNSLFPNNQSSNQGGLFQTFNSGGYSNILNGGSLTSNESNASDIVSGGGSNFNFSTAGTLAGLGSQMTNDVQTKSALGYAATGAKLGSKLGPYGAAFGFIAGGIYGGVKGKEQQDKIDLAKRTSETTEGVVAQMKSNIKDSQSSVSDFWQGQKNATENAYSVGHIDNFKNENRV